MLSLAYGFSFTDYPPTAMYGRGTSVHLAAAFGGSLLFACLCALGISAAKSHRFESVAIGLMALYLSLLVAYRFSIQLDFKRGWENQMQFWVDATAAVPDLTDGTVVFVLDHDHPASQFILTNPWADQIMLAQIYQFPDEWKAAPRLFVVSSDFTQTIAVEGDRLSWEVPAALAASHWELLPDSNIILLEIENGKLVRRFGSIQINEHALHLKSTPPRLQSALAT